MVRFSTTALALIVFLPNSSNTFVNAWSSQTPLLDRQSWNTRLQQRRNHGHSISSAALSNRIQQTGSTRITRTATTTARLSVSDMEEAITQTTNGAVSWATELWSQVTNMMNGIDLANTGLAIDTLKATLEEVVMKVQSFSDWTEPESVKLLVQSVVDTLQPVLSIVPDPVAVVLSAGLTYTAISSLLSWNAPPAPGSPYPMKRYDPIAARAYFDTRPNVVIARGLRVALLSTKFALGILTDYLNKSLQTNADLRAKQLTKLLTTLGPSFIKIGQSLSIRTDILSPAYVRGLKSLQDQVPAFPTALAKDMIMEELGISNLDEMFSEFAIEPVAAASLGQVYKARLRSNNKEVAVKIQRPDIMNQIALDMHLIREVAPILKRTFNLNTDLEGTADAWGTGFVDELNYLDEAENAVRFTESMQTTPLANVVFAPPVVAEATTERVLTTEWVDGERLDKSTKEDVTVLCSIAMNTYLTMMLETGLLHCDPHPGNLLRTKDGKLCILDWGMVTRLDSNLQVTLIEHMAHLTGADYAEVPRDLLLLGFIPESKKDLIKDSGVVETLSDIYGAWTKGGGAAAINVNKVVAQLQDLTATRGNLFQIPAYFAYIAKSFSVLEGIGLSNDANYSIINECLPYVSKRLLTDKSERTGGALGTFIFGPSKNDLDTRLVDYDRVEQLISGFGDYSTSASGALMGKEDTTKVQLFEDTADQILDLVLTEDETPLQSILVEQMSKIILSSSRSLWSDVRERSGILPSGRSVLGTMVDPLGFWRTSPIVRMNALDIKTVETTRDLINLLQAQSSKSPLFDVSTMTNDEIVQLSQVIVQKLWERRRGVAMTGGRLARMLVTMTADKLERGEREIMVLEPTNVSTDVTNYDGKIVYEEDKEAVPSTNKNNLHQSEDKSSARLQGARQILAQLENES